VGISCKRQGRCLVLDELSSWRHFLWAFRPSVGVSSAKVLRVSEQMRTFAATKLDIFIGVGLP